MAVLVILENWDGKFKKQTFEIVTFAVRIAELIDDDIKIPPCSNRGIRACVNNIPHKTFHIL